jgi:hypothetical protein
MKAGRERMHTVHACNPFRPPSWDIQTSLADCQHPVLIQTPPGLPTPWLTAQTFSKHQAAHGRLRTYQEIAALTRRHFKLEHASVGHTDQPHLCCPTTNRPRQALRGPPHASDTSGARHRHPASLIPTHRRRRTLPSAARKRQWNTQPAHFQSLADQP